MRGQISQRLDKAEVKLQKKSYDAKVKWTKGKVIYFFQKIFN